MKTLFVSFAAFISLGVFAHEIDMRLALESCPPGNFECVRFYTCPRLSELVSDLSSEERDALENYCPDWRDGDGGECVGDFFNVDPNCPPLIDSTYSLKNLKKSFSNFVESTKRKKKDKVL